MIFLAALSLLMAGPGQDEGVPKVVPFDASQVVEMALNGPNWRPWVQPGTRFTPGRSVVPSATVEVVESSERERQLRLLEFRARTAPLLKRAFDLGYAFRTNVQLLAEFMAQDPARPNPPSVPSVFYNNFKPPPENPAFQLQLATGWSRLWVNVRKESEPGR
jgi:hypothetical protein